MAERNCDKCVYGRRSGNCTAWNCKGTVTVEDIKAEARQSAIDELLNNVSESIIWDVLAEIMKRNIGASDGAERIINYLQKVAEQLKENNNG